MRLARASRAVAKVRGLTHDRRSGKQLYPAKQQGHPAVRAEFHCLCAAARCRLPLFGGPEVFCFTASSIVRSLPHCALASAIAKGGKSFRELVRELEPDFPSDKIHEALTRLLSRHYVIPTSRSSNGAAAAYWASLGLSPEAAGRNLQKCRVRIQSINVEGA